MSELICMYCNGPDHGPQLCPYVKAVEYYETGKIKRVEFKTPRDYQMPPVASGGVSIGAPCRYPYPQSGGGGGPLYGNNP